MKYTQKMVLIPETEYHTLLKKSPPPSEPSTNKRFKDDMQELLQGDRDHTAATHMSQLVGTYLRHKESEQPPPPVKKARKGAIMEFFDPIYHRKLTLLLSKLRDEGIGWNEENELTLPSGEVIQHSNIVDLLKEAIVASRKKKREDTSTPLGWQSFVEAIASSSIPKSIFTKKSTLEDIGKVQHEWEVY